MKQFSLPVQQTTYNSRRIVFHRGIDFCYFESSYLEVSGTGTDGQHDVPNENRTLASEDERDPRCHYRIVTFRSRSGAIRYL